MWSEKARLQNVGRQEWGKRKEKTKKTDRKKSKAKDHMRDCHMCTQYWGHLLDLGYFILDLG